MRVSQPGIIADFYHRGIGDMGPGVRTLFEEHLLTASGYRSTKALDDVIGPGVSQSDINTLVNRRLLRVEDRLGIPHVEIIHDVLTAVISESRRERDAEEAREQERVERKKKLQKILIPILIVICLLFLALAGIASYQWNRAEEEARTALALKLALDAKLVMTLRPDQPELAVLLAIESLKRDQNPEAAEVVPSGAALMMSQLFSFSHDAAVTSLAFIPEADRHLATSSDGKVRTWDISTGKELEPSQTFKEIVNSVAFSPDGQILAAGGGKEVRLRYKSSGNELNLLSHEKTVTTVAFSPDGKRLASGSTDMTVRVWNLEKPKAEPLILRGHRNYVTSVLFSPDGERLASASVDNTTRIWHVSSRKELKSLKHERPVTWVVFSPDGKRIATASGKTARLWDVVTGSELKRFYHPDMVTCVALSSDGKCLATASSDMKARIWDISAGEDRVPRTAGHPDIIVATLSPDGKLLATASSGNKVRIRDASTGEDLIPFRYEDYVISVAFSRAGKKIAMACTDNMARVWDVITGEKAKEFPHDDFVTSVALSPDGTRLATASTDMTVRVWDVATGTELRQFPHDGQVNSVVFSPDGKRLATGSLDNTARLWDTSGERRQPLALGHEAPVTATAFSPDGNLLVTASGDKVIRVWDASRGKELARFRSQEVASIAFSDGAAQVIAALADGTVQKLAWKAEDMIKKACEQLKQNLSEKEWTQYIGSEPCRPTCDNLPSRCNERGGRGH
jgi:WD40 repeat protein